METPVHGTGQGSCSSPALWLLISSLLMDILEKTANGMEIIDVNNKYKLKQWIEGFVDDTSIIVNIDFASQCIKNIINKLDFDGTTWAGLEVSGGKLELLKCFYYVLTWKWEPNGDAIAQTKSEQGMVELNLNKENSEYGKLDQREVSESHKTLGTYKCIDGNEQDHKEYIKKEYKIWKFSV